MKFIRAFAIVNCLHQLYGVIKAFFIRNRVNNEKCVCPSDVLINLRDITLQ